MKAAEQSKLTSLLDVASQKGILITKGFSAIQKLSKAQSIVFGKTCTLTQAKLDILSSNTTYKWAKLDAEFWTYVCAVEEHSVTSHPIGRAVFAAGWHTWRSLGWRPRHSLSLETSEFNPEKASRAMCR